MADRRNPESTEAQLQAVELHLHGHGLSKRISASVSSGDENETNWDKTQRNRNGSGGDGDPDTGPPVVTIEQAFRNKQVPQWWQQLTLRALVVSCILGILFSVIVMKLNLTTGVIPSLNVSAGLLGFFLVKTWTKLLEKSGLLKVPFTRQENTVIQTCVVACYGIAFSGGFGSYMLGMSSKVAEQIGTDVPGNNANDVKDPSLGWIIGFLFVVSFLGLLSIVPLRKIMVIDYKLTYPSGTATALLINGFHTPEGDKLARKQVKMLGKFFAGSFAWGFFQWFFTGGDDCGFAQFPTFGLKARDQRFYFDFSMTYVGAGMICPHLVNISILLGSIISWGILWPIIDNQKGSWFPANLPQSSMRGLQGYKVFISIAIILGDGLYNFLKIVSISVRNAYRQYQNNKARTGGSDIPLSNSSPATTTPTTPADDVTSYDEQRRNAVFMRDGVPIWAAAAGYVALASISIGVIPQLFPTMRWYYVLVAYCMAPIMAFCNAYGCGLTDWSLASTYGKLAIFLFGAWAAHQPGQQGIVAALAGCGVLMSIVSTAADLMQDFKTGYLTLSSPRSMFLAQFVGTAMGCIVGPCTFWLFYKAFNVGDPNGEYPAPYALIYRNMALLGVQGFDSLPRHCLTICLITFVLAAVINLIRDCVPARVAQYIPLPMAMAIPFYLGAYFAIDMCVGTLIVFVWQRIDRRKADVLAPAVASGLLCGDGIWTLPSSILALAKVQPPICMKFLSRSANSKVDAFLGAS